MSHPFVNLTTEQSIMQQVLRKQVVIANGFEDVSRFVADPRTRTFIEDYEKHNRDYFSAINTAKDEGKIEGQLAVALNMQRKGFDLEVIADLMNISIDEVKSFLN